MPCALIVLDELQQYIGENPDRSYTVQLVTEACCKKFGGRLLFVATGQSALFGTALLQRLKDRYTVSVELSDTDVEAVTRKIVLAKTPTMKPQLDSMLKHCSGEIDRQLYGTRIGSRPEDATILAADYPILPARRRLWEKLLRAVDRAGTAGQLRTQLRIVHEAVRTIANQPLGTVVPADFIFDQLSVNMLQSNVLSRDIDEIIRKQRDGTEDGILCSRLCAMIFLISQLPKEAGADIGVLATPDVLADLLVDDLVAGSANLRKTIPELLGKLIKSGDLMQVGEDYRIQTREGAAWTTEYNNHYTRFMNDASRIAEERTALLRVRCQATLRDLRLNQGNCREPRKFELYTGADRPKPAAGVIPVWIRDGWSDSESAVRSDAQQAGLDSELVFIFLPRQDAEVFKTNIAGLQAAQETLSRRGAPTAQEGMDARKSMETREREHSAVLSRLLDDLFRHASVIQGGGSLVEGQTLREAVENALKSSLVRLFPQFTVADDRMWEKVFERAKKGDGSPLEVLNYHGEAEKHPVCAQLLSFIAAGKKGSDLRKHFSGHPFGWPQDAVDGALLTLLRCNLITVTLAGVAVDPRSLDRANIGAAYFKLVSVVVTTQHLLEIRKVLQEASIGYQSGQEIKSMPGLIRKLLDMGRAAGGAAPCPVQPDLSQCEELQNLSGNELLVRVFDISASLLEQIPLWKQRAEQIRQRLPRWDSLNELIKYAAGLPGLEAVKQAVTAIVANRLLLEEPDPVAPLCEQVTGELRQALQDARTRYSQVYEEAMSKLVDSAIWIKLDPSHQARLLASRSIGSVPGIRVATENEVLLSLQECSLQDWQVRTDALPQRFADVLLAAAKLLEPQAVSYRPHSARLSDETEVDQYLTAMKEEIMKQIGAGHPVIV